MSQTHPSMSIDEIKQQFEAKPSKKAVMDALLKKFKPAERQEWSLKMTQRMRTFVEADMFRPGRETMAPQMMKAYCDIIESMERIDDLALRKLQLWKVSEEDSVLPFRRAK